jgi:hypothetical protein
MVTYVLDEKTQHVASLVSRNKTSRRSRGQSRGVGRRYAGFLGRELSRHNVAPMKRIASHDPVVQYDSSHQQSTYNIFRGQVKQMMYDHPDGIHMEMFDDEFKNSFGEYPPLTVMGYSGLFALLLSMRDIVHLHSNQRNEVIVSGVGKWRSNKLQSSAVTCSGNNISFA